MPGVDQGLSVPSPEAPRATRWTVRRAVAVGREQLRPGQGQLDGPAQVLAASAASATCGQAKPLAAEPAADEPGDHADVGRRDARAPGQVELVAGDALRGVVDGELAAVPRGRGRVRLQRVVVLERGGVGAGRPCTSAPARAFSASPWPCSGGCPSCLRRPGVGQLAGRADVRAGVGRIRTGPGWRRIWPARGCRRRRGRSAGRRSRPPAPWRDEHEAPAGRVELGRCPWRRSAPAWARSRGSSTATTPGGLEGGLGVDGLDLARGRPCSGRRRRGARPSSGYSAENVAAPVTLSRPSTRSTGLPRVALALRVHDRPPRVLRARTIALRASSGLNALCSRVLAPARAASAARA